MLRKSHDSTFRQIWARWKEAHALTSPASSTCIEVLIHRQNSGAFPPRLSYRGEWNINRKPFVKEQRPRDSGPRINDRIDSREILLIDEKGEKVGVMSPQQALTLAEQAGLDLVEISPGTQPPVCKILDYGKYKYQAQKKANEARKKQKTIEIKEIKIRPNIDTHDYGVKMRAIRRFFEEGDKVKVTLRFRGREMAHQDIGFELLQQVKKDTAELAKVESEPRFEGRQVVMVLAPK
jgi:translation initiation factor IF-3